MGLTIHYRLSTSLAKPKDLRRLVETMRQFALDLPFQEVGELTEWTARDDATDDTDHWLKDQTTAFVEDNDCQYPVLPLHVVAFSTRPGEGCQVANFGFCLYPPFIYLDSQSGSRRRLATKLMGWQWSSSCTTQYASDSKHGGIDHFLRCHLCVVKMLDCIKQSGLATVEVQDDGHYWERRDPKALAQEVGAWNEVMAGFFGIMRLALGRKLHSAITGFENFDYLRAKGLERLADLWRSLQQFDTEE